MARLRLASVLVVVVRWSTDLDVIFIISDIRCIAMIEDENTNHSCGTEYTHAVALLVQINLSPSHIHTNMIVHHQRIEN